MDRPDLIAFVLARHDLDVDPEWVAEGWSTLVAGELARSVQRSIDAADRPAVAHAFETMRLAWRDGDHGVRNDVVISFLRHLDLADGKVPRAWARDLMPPMIRAPFEHYMEQ